MSTKLTLICYYIIFKFSFFFNYYIEITLSSEDFKIAEKLGGGRDVTQFPQPETLLCVQMSIEHFKAGVTGCYTGT